MTTITSLVLDAQYDNLPGGSIDATGSGKAISQIAALAASSDLVIATKDWHPVNHFSFSSDPLYEDKSWPAHCVQGTKGARLFPAIQRQADYVISKGMNPYPPDDYSAFVGKTLRPVEHLGDILNKNVTDIIVVCGFLLEIGVKYTAFDANALGWWKNVVIPLDCTGTLRPRAQTEIIYPLLKAGIQIVESWKDIEWNESN
jgi:nicotinamidase/pyrazinamidase